MTSFGAMTEIPALDGWDLVAGPDEVVFTVVITGKNQLGEEVVERQCVTEQALRETAEFFRGAVRRKDVEP